MAQPPGGPALSLEKDSNSSKSHTPDATTEASSCLPEHDLKVQNQLIVQRLERMRFAQTIARDGFLIFILVLFLYQVVTYRAVSSIQLNANAYWYIYPETRSGIQDMAIEYFDLPVGIRRHVSFVSGGGQYFSEIYVLASNSTCRLLMDERRSPGYANRAYDSDPYQHYVVCHERNRIWNTKYLPADFNHWTDYLRPGPNVSTVWYVQGESFPWWCDYGFCN